MYYFRVIKHIKVLKSALISRYNKSELKNCYSTIVKECILIYCQDIYVCVYILEESVLF